MGYILVIILFIFIFLFLFFLFRKVQQIMEERRHNVEIAIEQLTCFYARSCETQNNPEYERILKQKEASYKQAVMLYQIARENPLCWLPATLMGFRPIKEDADSYRR